jgi:nicotinate-nucleotide adenylyltransferase
MKLGLFGGSFDPIHRGHVEPVRAALAEVGLDRVLYLPTARPPHKRTQRLAPPWARFAMVELALLDEPRLQVSPYELQLERPAYTVETLEHFRRELPDAELHLLIGEDSFRDLAQWVRWSDIVRLANLVVLARPLGGATPAPLPDELRALAEGPTVRFVRDRPVDVSSTAIRAALERGEEPPAGALADPVVQYIHKYKLYR